MSTSIISTASLQLLISNLEDQVSKTTFPANNKSYTPAQAVSLAQEVVLARQAVQTSKGAVTASRAKLTQAETTNLPILAAVRSSLVNLLAGDADKMATLGVAPRKRPAPRTLQQKIEAREKNLATRAARGTKGKKQKAEISGNVTGVVVTPITSSGSPAAPPVGSPQASSTTVSVASARAPVNTTAPAPAAPAPSPSPPQASSTTAPVATNPAPANPAQGPVALGPLSTNGAVSSATTPPLTNG